jgi:hypothetical protein
MNNEPVAFMHKTISSWVSTFIYPETEPDEWLPLYTHPAKTLTDAELFNVYADLEEVYTGNNFPVDLGRAILRKAQEK